MLLDKNLEEFNLLLKAIKNYAFHFIVIQYNHYDLLKECIQTIEGKYPDKKIEFIDFKENIKDGTLQLIQSKSNLVILQNFETILEDENQSFAIGFNQRRDKISARKGQVIAFLPAGNSYLRAFQKKMPDLSSITNIIINLEQEITKSNLDGFISIPYNNEFDNIPDAETEIIRIVKRLEDLKKEPENKDLFAKLNFNLATAYSFTGQFEKAKDVLLNLKDDIEDDEDLMGQFYNEFGMLLYIFGKYEQAKEYLEKSISYCIIHFGENHPKIITRYSNLALVLKDLAKYEEAKNLLEQSLKSSINYYGEYHQETSIIYSNLGIVLMELGNFIKAKEYLEKSIDIKNRFNKNHSTSSNYSNLSLVYFNLNDLKKAIEFIQIAIKLDIKNLGQGHPNTSTNYSNLALYLYSIGDYLRSLEILKKVLKFDIKNFGENHPDTAKCYINIGTVYMSLRDFQNASIFLNKALTIFTKTLGKDHPSTKISIENLKTIEEKMKLDK